MMDSLTSQPIVTREQWIEQRKELLKREKELTRQADALAAERRRLPWVRIEKTYTFQSPQGPVTLGDLFMGRPQLIIYHFMFGPDWAEGCPSCSMLADHADATLPHLAARNVTLAMVSRAPLPKIQAFKQRMGWRFPWVSSYESDFNFDFNVSFREEEIAKGSVYYNYKMQSFPSSEAPGISVFYRDAAGGVYHTYSAFNRGAEPLIGTYMFLDMVPRGRDEDHLEHPMAWVRHHDRYGTDIFADADKPYWPSVEAKPSAQSAGGCGCGSHKTAV